VPFYQRPVKNGKRGKDIFPRRIDDVVLPQSKFCFGPHKKHNEVEGSVKKKMGGTLWEEPIFSLIYPGT